MSFRPIKKIIWAVDTMEPTSFQKNAELLIASLTRATGAEVRPVHVLSYPFANPAGTTDFEQAYLALAEKRLKELQSESDLSALKRGKIFVNKYGSVQAAVEMLLDFAEQDEADAIVCSTHSRGAVAKLFMGSFAEELLLLSDIPVFTVNPQSTVREKIANVLFPTTFDPIFQPAFEQTARLCKLLDANLTLFYKEPFVPMLEPGYDLFAILDDLWKERKATSDKWRQWAEVNQAPVEMRFDQAPGNVPDEISAYASRHGFDLIAMVSETSEFEGPRLGSICRKVVRSADCPVWTIKTDEWAT